MVEQKVGPLEFGLFELYLAPLPVNEDLSLLHHIRDFTNSVEHSPVTSGSPPSNHPFTHQLRNSRLPQRYYFLSLSHVTPVSKALVFGRVASVALDANEGRLEFDLMNLCICHFHPSLSMKTRLLFHNLFTHV